MIASPRPKHMALPIKNEPLFIAKVAALNLSGTPMSKIPSVREAVADATLDPHVSSDPSNYSNSPEDYTIDDINQDAAVEGNRDMASLDALPIEVLPLPYIPQVS